MTDMMGAEFYCLSFWLPRGDPLLDAIANENNT